jgi:fructose-1,6-bisphosphatase class II
MLKNIGLDMIRVTEGAAIAASQWVGSGNKEAADKAASDAMRERFAEIDFLGRVAIGEGVKDKSYGLFQGEMVGGAARTPETCFDLAIDPIEGTTPTVTSGPEAISTIAFSNENTMYQTPAFYMNKLAYGKEIASKGRFSINMHITQIVKHMSSQIGKPLDKMMVCILNRPRHEEWIKGLRELGVRIKLIQDCDVSGAIAACLPNSGVDLLYGIGGAPEAVISAAAIKCMGGDFQVYEVDKEMKQSSPILGMEDLVKGECAFVATGITRGSILDGVRVVNGRPVTNSVFMRSTSNTIRWMTTEHGN